MSIGVVIVARYRLDGEALAALLASAGEFRILARTSSPAEALATCRTIRPDALVVDATLVGRDVGYDVSAYLRVEEVGPILLLDSELHHHRLAAVVRTRGLGYFTRHADYSEIAAGIQRLVAGEAAFDVLASRHLVPTPEGWKLAGPHRSTALAKLTPRERDVFRLLAAGNSVKRCAEMLKLAHSTVDNHKSRLMKKLGVHKTTELTRLAIREGLVQD